MYDYIRLEVSPTHIIDKSLDVNPEVYVSEEDFIIRKEDVLRS